MIFVVTVFCAVALAQPAPIDDRRQGLPIGTGSTAPTVTLTAPAGGWTVGRMLKVEGTVSDRTVDPISVSINGDRYLMRTIDGRFSRQFPAATGKNVVTVLATNKGGTTRAQATAFAQIPPVPLKAVLTSDTDGVYTDLHIYEPTELSEKSDDTIAFKGMAHVFWANTESPSGGTFFLNEQGGDFDQPGYGPYLYVHRAPPRGTYLIAANYWPSGDKPHTLATLNLVLFEGTAKEIRRAVRVPLATPGTTRVLAWVRFLGGDRARIWVPGSDPTPRPEEWPKNLDEAARQLASGGAEESEG